MKSIVVLLTLFCQCKGQAGCLKGWIRSNDRCYYISGKVDTFDGANKYCKDRKTQLDPALTIEGYVHLVDVLSSYRAKCPGEQNCDDFWIGMQNSNETNWRTDNNYNRQCQLWANGYPRGNGTCGIMSLRGTWRKGYLKNVDCTSRFKYVCITCPNGYDYIPEVDVCFYFNKKQVNWNDAQTNCSQIKKGSHLVIIHDSMKQKAVEKYLGIQLTSQVSAACIHPPWTYAGPLIWMGAQTSNPRECKTPYVWKLAGEADIPFTYVNWFPGIPNCIFPGENCAMIVPEFGSRWEDSPCTDLFCSVCEF